MEQYLTVAIVSMVAGAVFGFLIVVKRKLKKELAALKEEEDP